MGCYDPMKTKGPVSWIPVKSKTYWSVHMNGLRHNSSGILETDLIAVCYCHLILDSLLFVDSVDEGD